MIKISVASLIGIIRICGGVAKKAIVEDIDYVSECKRIISAYMGLPDMFNVTNPENDSLHKESE